MNATKGVAISGTRALADFAATVRYEDLRPSLVDMLKLVMIDTLGAALAATTLGEGCAQLVSVAQRLGRGRSTVFGVADMVSAPIAAFANGGLAHALNFDPITGHLGISALTPALSVAEDIGNIDGRTFLAAVAAAGEVTARLAEARAAVSGGSAPGYWLEGQIFGYFGAAAGAGRVLRLTSAQMRDAFGIALMQTAGSMQVLYGGDPPAKAVYGAFPNLAGVLAAQLAAEGLDADCDALEGRAGLFPAFFDSSKIPAAALGDLGEKFLVENVAFKPWPTSGIVHPFIEATLRLYREGMRAQDVRRIIVGGSERARSWCEPVAERSAPANGAAAANSVQFGVAKALTAGSVMLADFTPEGLRDPETLRVARLIGHELGGMPDGSASVAIISNNGERREARVDAALGTLANPMTQHQIVEKFHQCAAHAKRPLVGQRSAKVIEAVHHIEDLQDMREFVALLT